MRKFFIINFINKINNNKVFSIFSNFFSYVYTSGLNLLASIKSLKKKQEYNQFFFVSIYVYIFFYVLFFFFFSNFFELNEEFIVSIGLSVFIGLIFFKLYSMSFSFLRPLKDEIRLKFVKLLIELAASVSTIIYYFDNDMKLWKLYYRLFLKAEKIVTENFFEKYPSIYLLEYVTKYKVIVCLNNLVEFYNGWFLDIFFLKRYFFFYFSRLNFFYKLLRGSGGGNSIVKMEIKKIIKLYLKN